MLPVRVSVLLAFLRLARAFDYSTFVDDFLSVTNGNFDNRQQVEGCNPEHAFVQYKFIPVYIPSLHPLAVWYTEWGSDRTSVRQYVGVIRPGPGDTLRVTLHNYTDVSLDRTSKFNLSKLQHLKSENLWDTKCMVEISRLHLGQYLAIWSDCNHVVNGFHAFYAVTFECDAGSVHAPPTVLGEFAQTPLVFRRTGKRYPMAGRTDNYDRICPRKQ